MKHNLLYPVDVTEENDPPLHKFPWIKPSHFLESLSNMNDLGILLAGKSSVAEAAPILEVFWDRYRRVLPQHQVFSSGKPLSQCLPIYLHGDEGITYRKAGVLIVAWQSALGFGSSRRGQEVALNYERMEGAGLPLNMLKSGMLTRLLTVVCPKEGLLKNVALI